MTKPQSQRVMEGFAVVLLVGAGIALAILIVGRMNQPSDAKRDDIAANDHSPPPAFPSAAMMNDPNVRIKHASGLPAADLSKLSVRLLARDKDHAFSSLSKDCKRLLLLETIAQKPGGVRYAVIDVESGKRLCYLENPKPKPSTETPDPDAKLRFNLMNPRIDFSPDGRRAVQVVGSDIPSLDRESIMIWDVATGNISRIYDELGSRRNEYIFLDERRLLVALRHRFEGALEVIDVESGEATLFSPFVMGRLAHRFEVQGDRLAVLGEVGPILFSTLDGTRRPLETQEVVLPNRPDDGSRRYSPRPVKYQRGELIRFSGDGKQLYVLSAETLEEWDAVSGAPIASYRIAPKIEPRNALMVVDRDRLIVPARNFVEVRSLKTSKLLSVLQLHQSGVQVVGADREGKQLVLSDPDNGLLLVDTSNDIPSGTIEINDLRKLAGIQEPPGEAKK